MIIYNNIKKRKPRKLNATQRQLASEWDAIVNSYKPKKQLVKSTSNKLEYTLSTGPRGKAPDIKSLGEWITGSVSSKPNQQYTGDKILGIGTLHKSNAIPVFTDEEAKSLASMRR